MLFKQIFCLCLITENVLCGVLILSSNQIKITGLKTFDEELYMTLKKSFEPERIISIKLESEKIPDECEHLFKEKYTSYVPTVTYTPDNAIILNDLHSENCNEIVKTINVFDSGHKNIIYLIFHTSIRIKRNSVELSADLNPTEDNKDDNNEEAAVLYDAQGKAMLYSSQQLSFRKQNDTYLTLGNATIVTIDERDNYSRLICSIPLEEGKITLRFRFPWERGYWFLTSVEIEDSSGKINLTNSQDITAPEAFSYACGGETIFSDANNTATLILYNLQVQPRSKNHRFSDAYNCVPFVTGPICSGLFVTSILAIGLLIGLNALGSIKTMDKFDNSKTKQLTITVIGE